MQHPAHATSFDDLLEGLCAAVDRGDVRSVHNPVLGLTLFNYTDKCVYDKSWDDITRSARGLILDVEAKRIVATPFPKFFNLSELQYEVPDLPYQVFEKVDGSLIIIFYHNGEWHTATRGSFSSDQARWAREKLKECGTERLVKGWTYLAEAIYPQNRIVVNYGDTSELVLLGGYSGMGFELNLRDLVAGLKWRAARTHNFEVWDDIVDAVAYMPRDKEGFVVRFSNGFRVKIKGDEYLRAHRAISNLTPLVIWEAMREKDDLQGMRALLPEEFWKDFDAIHDILDDTFRGLQFAVMACHEETRNMSNKELGLLFSGAGDRCWVGLTNGFHISPTSRKFLFPYRNDRACFEKPGRTRAAAFETFRPTGNRLDGYVPTSSMSTSQGCHDPEISSERLCT